MILLGVGGVITIVIVVLVLVLVGFVVSIITN